MAIAGLACVLGGPLSRPALAQAVEPPIDEQPPTLEKPKDAPTSPLPQDLEAFEGRPVRTIVLREPTGPKVKDPAEQKFRDLDAALDTLARAQLRSKVGQAFRPGAVQDDITRLNRLGRFKRVDGRVRLQDDGSVVITYTLIPQAVILAVQSVGNKEVSDQDILKRTDGLVNTPVDRYQLAQSCRDIEDLYRQKGFYLAQVTVDEQQLEESDIAVFRVREGERTKVTDIRFEGNLSFTARELRSQIKTKTAFPVLEKGPLDDEVLDQDVASLVAFYRDRGYLDVRADRTYRTSPNGREAIVTFIVSEGPLFTLRDITVIYPERAREFPTLEEARADAKPGEQVFALGPNNFNVYSYGVYTPEQLSGLMAIKPGDVYSDDTLRKSMESLREAYGQMGYTEATIDRRELRDVEKPLVDILLIVKEGARYKTGEIITQGNEITQQSVILGAVEVKPDRPLDSTALRESKRKLQQLRIFANPSRDNPVPVDVVPQEPDPDEPSYRDVLIKATETNTGELAAGVLVGSDSGLTARLAFTQKNFDVGDTPDTFEELISGKAFRGAGQTFQIEALPGTRFETYRLSLSDPTLLDTTYSGSGALFYTSRDYDEFDEDRLGTRFSIGRRFGTRWQATVPIRLENINLRDIQEDKPQDVWDNKGENVLTGVGLVLSRTTLDDPYRPGKGSRVELGIEQAGALGGDFTFTKFTAEATTYFTINEDFLGRRTVLRQRTAASYIPQDKGDVPVYERFYLGGQSFRGFNYRAVSPVGVRHDNGEVGDDVVGGTYTFFHGWEIDQPIVDETVSLTAFVDTGTSTFDPGFDEYRVSVGFGVRLYIPALSPLPLAFDFGFPVISEETDRERVFTFSLDLPFQ
ncbi:MAG: BamA/TamA family outer membrane protein [Phycisphaerae bacterium]|nr:BamA/TamA family outer membrane protein [Phycisphaerae bacterium]